MAALQGRLSIAMSDRSLHFGDKLTCLPEEVWVDGVYFHGVEATHIPVLEYTKAIPVDAAPF